MQQDLFTACLLHDIGKLVLNPYVSDHFEKIQRLVNESKCDFAEAEKAVLGMTHAEAGARVLEKWHFNPELVNAVRFHHNPEALPGSPITHFVTLADIISMMMGYSTGLDAMEYKGFPDLYKKYKMKEKDIEAILHKALDEVKNAVKFERRKQNSDLTNGSTDRRKTQKEDKWWS